MWPTVYTKMLSTHACPFSVTIECEFANFVVNIIRTYWTEPGARPSNWPKTYANVLKLDDFHIQARERKSRGTASWRVLHNLGWDVNALSSNLKIPPRIQNSPQHAITSESSFFYEKGD